MRCELWTNLLQEAGGNRCSTSSGRTSPWWTGGVGSGTSRRSGRSGRSESRDMCSLENKTLSHGSRACPQILEGTARVPSFQSALLSREMFSVPWCPTSLGIACAMKIIISLCIMEWGVIKSIGLILLSNSVYTTQEILQIWPINQWISISFFLRKKGREEPVATALQRPVPTPQLCGTFGVYLQVTVC